MAFVKFVFPGYTGAALYLKPSFSFPFIKPPNMIPCVDNSVLEQFTAKAIPLKPEAPWIKKCSFGIKFTDEIYFTDDDREATPDEEKEYKKRKQQQQQRAARAAAGAFARSISERVILRTNIFFEQQQNQAVLPLDEERMIEEEAKAFMQAEGDPRETYSPLPDDIGSGQEEDDDMDEEEFKRALEHAKLTSEKLSQRPFSKK